MIGNALQYSVNVYNALAQRRLVVLRDSWCDGFLLCRTWISVQKSSEHHHPVADDRVQSHLEGSQSSDWPSRLLDTFELALFWCWRLDMLARPRLTRRMTCLRVGVLVLCQDWFGKSQKRCPSSRIGNLSNWNAVDFKRLFSRLHVFFGCARFSFPTALSNLTVQCYIWVLTWTTHTRRPWTLRSWRKI